MATCSETIVLAETEITKKQTLSRVWSVFVLSQIDGIIWYVRRRGEVA